MLTHRYQVHFTDTLPSAPVQEEQSTDRPTCAICLDDQQVGEERQWIQLKCDHHFHLHCQKEAFKHSPNCPLCRRNIVPATTDWDAITKSPGRPLDESTHVSEDPSSKPYSTLAKVAAFGTFIAGATLLLAGNNRLKTLF